MQSWIYPIDNLYPSHNPSQADYLFQPEHMVSVSISNNGNTTAQGLTLIYLYQAMV